MVMEGGTGASSVGCSSAPSRSTKIARTADTLSAFLSCPLPRLTMTKMPAPASFRALSVFDRLVNLPWIRRLDPSALVEAACLRSGKVWKVMAPSGARAARKRCASLRSGRCESNPGDWEDAPCSELVVDGVLGSSSIVLSDMGFSFCLVSAFRSPCLATGLWCSGRRRCVSICQASVAFRRVFVNHISNKINYLIEIGCSAQL